MYKLRRLWDLQLSEDIYEVRAIPDEKLQFGTHMTDDYFVQLHKHLFPDSSLSIEYKSYFEE